ncbi:hypothetical protein POTOM_053692 [Populus tomentosa]|uniref:Uncharacterized protein n=1 Tax=Populus tomentosa TaxID=118781 RepID=A0A8X7XWD5_POPTO|nr:hypothetical protein POTOM_054887 [Populus tomentosa]KAG6742753.1 hypothetical protein POTOM_053692 [Populus tomentosa]
MSLCFRAFIKKKGKNNVTVDDLIHVITPKGRGGGSSVSEVYLLLSTQDNLLVYLLFSRIQISVRNFSPASIPDSIKAELLQRIRSFLVQAAV